MTKNGLSIKDSKNKRKKNYDRGTLADPRVLEELDYLRLSLQKKMLDKKRK